MERPTNATPLPVQLEHWIRIAENKKSPYDLRESSLLHLRNIRDILDKVIRNNSRQEQKNRIHDVKEWKHKRLKHENLSTR